jgi:hypothetical protein
MAHARGKDWCDKRSTVLPLFVFEENEMASQRPNTWREHETHTKKLRPEEDMVIPHSRTWHPFLNETNGDHALECISENEQFFYCVQWRQYSYIATVVRYRVPHFPPDSCLKHHPVSSVPSWFLFKTSPSISSSFLIHVQNIALCLQFLPDSCLKHHPVSSVPSWFLFKTSPSISSSFLIHVQNITLYLQFLPESCLKHHPLSPVPSWFLIKTSPCILTLNIENSHFGIDHFLLWAFILVKHPRTGVHTFYKNLQTTPKFMK